MLHLHIKIVINLKVCCEKKYKEFVSKSWICSLVHILLCAKDCLCSQNACVEILTSSVMVLGGGALGRWGGGRCEALMDRISALT